MGKESNLLKFSSKRQPSLREEDARYLKKSHQDVHDKEKMKRRRRRERSESEESDDEDRRERRGRRKRSESKESDDEDRRERRGRRKRSESEESDDEDRRERRGRRKRSEKKESRSRRDKKKDKKSDKKRHRKRDERVVSGSSELSSDEGEEHDRRREGESRRRRKKSSRKEQEDDEMEVRPEAGCERLGDLSERAQQKSDEIGDDIEGSSPTVQKAVITGPSETIRRVIGPARPSADMLAAAAQLTDAEARLREAELELENDPLVGPPPPTVVAEAAFANDAERFEEVTRMLSREIGNAYDVLGVKSTIDPNILKKKYWKLSLLVHPDKCSHPQAHEAFMALNKAFKDLQDPTKKAEIDGKIADQQAREEFEADMKARREAAQWRRLRGEEEEGDDELLKATPAEPVRDEWMTKLPPERQAGGPPVQQNTFFSKAEKSGRGDTSVWTDTPADKAEKAKMQYLEAYKQAALTSGPVDELEMREKERADKEAQLMDSYNSHKRSQSLMDKHKDEQLRPSKKKVDKAGKRVIVGAKPRESSEQEAEWKTNHPWKPWDREKDLTAGRQSVNLDPKQFKEGLASRFGASQGEPRNFL